MRFFTIVSFLITALFSIQDLGTFGKTYEIKEKDFVKEIEKKVKNLDKKKLQRQLKSSIEQSFVVKNDIPRCVKNRTRYYNPIQILPGDIFSPNGEVIYKRGYKFNPIKQGLVSKNFKIVFLDDKHKSFNKFLKKYKESTLVLVNGNLYPMMKKNIQISKSNEKTLQQFDLKCTPSVYTVKNNKFYIKEYK